MAYLCFEITNQSLVWVQKTKIDFEQKQFYFFFQLFDMEVFHLNMGVFIIILVLLSSFFFTFKPKYQGFSGICLKILRFLKRFFIFHFIKGKTLVCLPLQSCCVAKLNTFCTILCKKGPRFQKCLSFWFKKAYMNFAD